jgi:DNA-directed RNA polymerase subunit P
MPTFNLVPSSNYINKRLNLDWAYETPMSNPEATGDVLYECMRCGTAVTNIELSKLPEIKCICGFRVFRKGRQPIVKQLKAI